MRIQVLTKVSIMIVLGITIGTIIPNRVHSISIGQKTCWHNGVSYATIPAAQSCSFDHSSLPNGVLYHSGEHPDDCLLDETLDNGNFQ